LRVAVERIDEGQGLARETDANERVSAHPTHQIFRRRSVHAGRQDGRAWKEAGEMAFEHATIPDGPGDPDERLLQRPTRSLGL
jgi:hypothetical protein